MAEQHHRLKCPKCDRVQSASNSKCSNCGHDLSKARRGKFARLGESASPLAQALATQAFLSEAGFQEILHPRARTGKFRGKLGVPTTGKRPLRGGQFPLGNKLPSGTGPLKGKRSPGKLEGPFTYRSGWRGFYDPGEGRYLGTDDIYKPRGFDPHTGTTHEPVRTGAEDFGITVEKRGGIYHLSPPPELGHIAPTTARTEEEMRRKVAILKRTLAGSGFRRKG
jgi:hypothetical protein